MIFIPIPPRCIAQETLNGIRMIGDTGETLLSMGRGFGKIKNVTKAETPYLLFNTTHGKQQNISYFRSSVMRDVAYLRILNPNLHANHCIHLALQEYFSKFNKDGSAQHAEEFKKFFLDNFSKTLFTRNYRHIFPYISDPEELFMDWKGRAAIYIYSVEQLKLPTIAREYTLDLLIKKVANGHER